MSLQLISDDQSETSALYSNSDITACVIMWLRCISQCASERCERVQAAYQRRLLKQGLAGEVGAAHALLACHDQVLDVVHDLVLHRLLLNA
jgi:hypothetical protein